MYVIYAEDDKGNSSTKQIYLGENKTPITTNLKIASSAREIKLQAIDTVCHITKIKIAKRSEINDIEDFNTNGKSLTITPAKEINLTHTIEDSLF